METGDRAAFLQTVRHQLRDGIPSSALRPMIDVVEPLPPVAYSAPQDDLPGCFCAAVAGVGGQPIRVPNTFDVYVETLVQLCRRHGASRAVISADPECNGLLAALRAAGIDAHPLDGVARAAKADIGISGAVYGVALTGSIVVDAARAKGRTASLLPPVHVALVRVSNLLAIPGEVFERLASQENALPSNLVLITGPSRSSDIEMQLTLGVHGPQTLIILLLEDEAPALGSRQSP